MVVVIQATATDTCGVNILPVALNAKWVVCNFIDLGVLDGITVHNF